MVTVGPFLCLLIVYSFARYCAFTYAVFLSLFIATNVYYTLGSSPVFFSALFVKIEANLCCRNFATFLL